jgi:hypothetical protein
MTYKLTKKIIARHEHNIGPFPSGYAYLKIQLEPAHQKEQEVFIISSSEGLWKVRSPEEYRNIHPGEIDGLIDSFKSMIEDSVSEGIQQGLAETLEQPVVGVKAILLEVIFDIMYSTKAAFYYASLHLIERMLKEADEKGRLIKTGGNS